MENCADTCNLDFKERKEEKENRRRVERNDTICSFCYRNVISLAEWKLKNIIKIKYAERGLSVITDEEKDLFIIPENKSRINARGCAERWK